jgi:hypothetical protein
LIKLTRSNITRLTELFPLVSDAGSFDTEQCKPDLNCGYISTYMSKAVCTDAYMYQSRVLFLATAVGMQYGLDNS